MKKTLIILVMFIIFLIIYLLQSNLFTWFNIAGICPNLFIIFILFIGLYAGKRMGIIMGIIIGILLDLFIGKTYGISSVMYALIGFIGGYLDKNFSKDSRIMIMLMTIGTTLIYEMGTYLLTTLFSQGEIEIIAFIKIILIEIIFNTILMIILYPLLQKAKDIVEENFKTNNILTKYF